MYALLNRSLSPPRNRSVRVTQQSSVTSGRAPQLYHRQHRASYYFEASRHTSLSFRLLLSQLKEPKESVQYRRTRDFLCLSMDNLLASIRPGLDDDAQSREYFTGLLRMHLSYLTDDEMTQLRDALKAAQFSCNVVETVIDDEVYRDHGFSNGPPHAFHRTLMQTTDFFHLLEDMKKNIFKCGTNFLPSDFSVAVRDALHSSVRDWNQANKTIDGLRHSVSIFTKALNFSITSYEIITDILTINSTKVTAGQKSIYIDSRMAEAVMADTKGNLFAELLRDVLELLLTQKLFGIAVPPDKLTRTQHQQLSAAIAQIYTNVPSSSGQDFKQRASATLKDAADFGEIKIQPTTGVALGHAWIVPSLSLVPDKRKNHTDLGYRFMHSGFRLEPADSPIREWPAYFMSMKENEESYPDQHAWPVRVPVDSTRLLAAAREVRHEWESLGLPYRFIGTTPEMPATGCRVTVWEAVQRGMTDDTLTLFKHYNSGLPDPQSPTELWQRLEGLMQWMETLATE